MYHHQEYPAKRLSPVWKKIVELIEIGEYNQAREEMEFLYRQTNNIISILEEMYKPKDSKKRQRKPQQKKPKNKEMQDLTTKEGRKNNADGKRPVRHGV